MIKRLVNTTLLLVLVNSNFIFSQNLNCDNPINYARDLYSIGDFRNLKTILKNCVLNQKKSTNFGMWRGGLGHCAMSMHIQGGLQFFLGPGG